MKSRVGYNVQLYDVVNSAVIMDSITRWMSSGCGLPVHA